MNPPLNNASGQCVIRIGVFFDGTGKNGNIHAGSKGEKFNVTNIYRLYKHYGGRQTNNCEHHMCKVYVEGIGTLNNHDDAFYSLATGDEDWWDEGYGPDSKLKFCYQRMESQLATLLSEGHIQSENIAVEFDVFGFSRGAVLARHLTNLIHDKYTAVNEDIRALFKKNGRVLLGDPVVNFLGLFDSVGSFIDRRIFDSDPHDSGYTRSLKVQVPKEAARHAFQLNAMHECRYNYSLHTLHGHYPELTIAGAHSDVGGGYPERENEVKDLTQYKTCVPFNWAKSRVQKELNLLLNLNSWRFLTEQIIYHGDEKLVCIAKSHRNVKGHIQFVSFITMVKVAEKCGCVFSPDYMEYVFDLPDDLVPYFESVLSVAQDTLEGKSTTLNQSLVDSVMKNYVHLSASWVTALELYFEFRNKSQTMLCRDSQDYDKYKAEAINLSGLKNFWPDRPDKGWARKIFH